MKKRFSLLFAMIATLIFCSACNKADGFFTNSDNIFVNSNGTAFSFCIAIFSQKKITTVDYVAIEGKNISPDNFSVEITNGNTDVLDKYKHTGYYIQYILVEITPVENISHCEIDKLILNINGVRREVSFSTTLKHDFGEGHVFTEALRISVVPVEFASDLINSSFPIVYEFYANESVILNSIHFKDFLVASDITVALNDEPDQASEFPITVNAGQTLKIGFSFTSQLANTQSYIATNIFFDYTTQSDNVSHFNSAYITFDPIFPIIDDNTEHINKLTDALI